MFRKEMRQICATCKGTGINKTKPLSTQDGKPLLAPVYEKGEGNRRQFANCGTCDGTGWSMQPSPRTIFVDGEKKALTEEETRDRYEVSF